MGLLNWLFGDEPRPAPKTATEYRLLNDRSQVHIDWYTNIYDNALVRSAIEAKARHISKLKVELQGSAQPKLKNKMRYNPNPWQTWSQFLARCSTILDCTNNLFIVPVRDERTLETIGVFPILPTNVSLVEDKRGKLWIKYKFINGQYGAIEFDKCAYLTKHQYQSDFFGDSNVALKPTMDLIAVQESSIKSAVQNSNNYRFLATVTNFVDPEDLAEERKRFTEYNLKGENTDGLLLFPKTYGDIKEVSNKQFTVDADQTKLIKENVLDYIGINEDVIQGKANSEQLDAFFNLAIEPFAIALSEALSKMIYTEDERFYGNHVYVNANRLQYMSVSEKVTMAQQMGDRGALTINEIRELFNYPPLPDGDVAFIRGEYYTVQDKTGGNENEQESSGIN